MCGRKRQRMGMMAAFMLLFMLVFTSCESRMDRVLYKTQADQAGEELPGNSDKTGELQVHFIDVGQGDAALITCDGHAMLFDAGGNDKGAYLQLYLMGQGVEQLDYVIGSHPESDHIGGMDVILWKYDCGKIMLPDVWVDTAAYRDVQEVMEYKDYRNRIPETGEVYQLGGAEFTIIAPNKDNYGDAINNYSIGIKLTYGQNSFIFTGDAEKEAEEDMLKNGISLDADVLKAGHHGSSDASGREFVEAVSPAYVVISCGKENDYGHPHQETLDILEAAGAKILRTDRQGSIAAISDGKNITWNLEPAASWQGAYYVGNKKNGKLHVSTCTSLPKEWNQVIFQSKEEAAEAGFLDYCGGCKP